MATTRAHLVLPPALLREIHALAGPRGRSAFLVETARAEVRRRKLLAFLEDKTPAWKDADHPELADGADAWVSKLRTKNDRALIRFSARRAAMIFPLESPF